MITREYRQNLRKTERLTSLASHIIVVFMMLCMATAILQVGRHILPTWQTALLTPLSFLIALDAIYTCRLLVRTSVMESRWWAVRLSEWVVILLVVRLVPYLANGFKNFPDDIHLWQENFLATFFTTGATSALAVIFLVWLATTLFAGDLIQLEGDEFLAGRTADKWIYLQRSEARRRIANLILTIGTLMLLPVAITIFEKQSAGEGTAELVNLVVYFLLSLVLLSLTQFAVARLHWILDDIPYHGEVGRRWIFTAWRLSWRWLCLPC